MIALTEEGVEIQLHLTLTSVERDFCIYFWRLFQSFPSTRSFLSTIMPSEVGDADNFQQEIVEFLESQAR